ncbi:hypothetical protein MNBD_GAMMA07-714 [hydrothermal vent metagenome]|uniref:HipA-like C-terminal domain-containing protein n=1 Tax=hydrothermal vent metagenome TaxID=652676 RepID=A0A3B0XKC6_9ZZZZ
MNTNTLEVWMDSNLLEGLQKVGTLHHEHGHIRFDYAKEWFDHPYHFNIDPDLSLDKGVFHPRPEIGNFGMLLDSSPDRWGQTLMKRREAIEAKDEKRNAHTLYAWDYLIGIQDETRQGALRFKYEGADEFLGKREFSTPPITQLRELEEIAYNLSSKRIDDLDKLRRWLSVLVAPGASLGGARPKANFTDNDGSLWIAKFPAKDDDRDIAAWEMLVHILAKKAIIDVPTARLHKFGENHHTFCVKRFDRDGGKRVFYASAMTMLGAVNSEEWSYLDLAQVIQNQGNPCFIKDDLEQLFRRVIFNVLTGNRDDHLRNHGFVLSENGWRLSKAFDINPNIDKASHVLNINDSDNSPDIQVAIETSAFYDLTEKAANTIASQIMTAVDQWQVEAKKLKIPMADIQIMGSAFYTK